MLWCCRTCVWVCLNMCAVMCECIFMYGRDYGSVRGICYLMIDRNVMHGCITVLYIPVVSSLSCERLCPSICVSVY